MTTFAQWLTENTVAPKGTEQLGVSLPGQLPNPAKPLTQEQGTAVEPTGVTATVDTIDKLPTIDNSAALKAINAELAKPGLQEALAALSPSIVESIEAINEALIMNKQVAHQEGTLKTNVKTNQGKTLKKGTQVHAYHDTVENKTHITHNNAKTGFHTATLDGVPSNHIDDKPLKEAIVPAGRNSHGMALDHGTAILKHDTTMSDGFLSGTTKKGTSVTYRHHDSHPETGAAGFHTTIQAPHPSGSGHLVQTIKPGHFTDHLE